MGPTGPGNDYAQRLESLLEPFSAHRAITLAETLLERGFAYDAPAAFALAIGPLPDLEAHPAIPRWLSARAGGEDALEEFRQSLVDLAQESDFISFVEQNEEMLWSILVQSAGEYTPEVPAEWMEDFYGYGADGYHTVLAPAMFPAGGYGAGILHPEGHWHVYSIARAEVIGYGEPRLPTGDDLERLAVHEWGHAFSDPAVFAHPALIADLRPQYEPVAQIMRDQHYPSLPSFVQEQVLRGIDALARKDLYGQRVHVQHLRDMNSRGFYLTERVLTELEAYRENRDRYPTFVDFAPTLLSRMAREEPRSPPPRIHPALWVRLILGGTALVAMLWWIVVGMRRRRERIENMEDFDYPDFG